MRPRVSWMTGNDDSILEFLDERDVAISPRGLYVNFQRENISISYRTIGRRLTKLEDKGLVERLDVSGSHYVITENGRAYLNEEIDASELEDDEE